MSKHLGFPITVEERQRLSGGASRVTWSLVDALREDGIRLPMTIREGSHLPKPTQGSGQLDCLPEYKLLKASEELQVPVPHIYFLLDPEDEVGFGNVMERIAGETIPRKNIRDDEYAGARPKLAAQCGEIAARIHSVKLSEVAFLKSVPPDMSPAKPTIVLFHP